MGNLADLAESFSFYEIRKRTLQSRFCSVLCDTTGDQDTLLNSGGLVIPLGDISLYVSFSPTIDDTIRTSLPREIRIALRNHKDLFLPRWLGPQRHFIHTADSPGAILDGVANHA
jgi:hypothetical protein